MSDNALMLAGGRVRWIPTASPHTPPSSSNRFNIQQRTLLPPTPQVIALSDAEWAPFWISYKALKKRIKELHDPEHPGPHPPRPSATAAAGPAPPAAGEGGSPPAAAAAAAVEAGAGSGGEGPSATNTEPTPKDLAQREGEVRFVVRLCARRAGLGWAGLGWAGLCVPCV